jgi:hypothetical protein
VHNFTQSLGGVARTLVLLISLSIAFFVSAEDGKSPSDETDDASTRVGDVLELKSGKELVGQLRSQGASHYLLEVIPGVVIQVPRAQVMRVTLDDRDEHLRRGTGDGDAEIAPRTVVESSRVSTELNRRLYRTLSDGEETEEYVEKPLSEIIENLSERSGVTIKLDDAFDALPDTEKRLTVRIEPDTTLYDFLTHQIQDRYPKAYIEYQFDRILIGLPDDAETSPATDSSESGAPE